MIAKKVSGYTLIEITVAMLITTIVIGTTYAIYSVIARSFHGFNIKNDRIAVAETLDHTIRRDFDKADTILKDTAGIAIATGDQRIKYIFSPGYVIRISTKPDTFAVSADSIVTRFQSAPLYDMNSNAEANRIDELDFSLRLEDKKIPYHYYKLYSSENLIHRIPDAVN